MRSTQVLFRGKKVGILLQDNKGAFEFRYHKDRVEDTSNPAMSTNIKNF